MIIYKATNKVDGKSYIGQTIQRLRRRRIRHLSDSKLKSGSYFHRALSKYGEDSFEWKAICKCISIEELNEKEISFIKEYDTMFPNGYNLTKGGMGSNGYKHKKEFIESISGENAIMKRPGVAEKLKGKNHIYHKSKEFRDRLRSNEVRKKAIENCSRMWKFIKPDGEVIIAKNKAKFCRENGLDAPTMSNVASGKSNSHKGWRCLKLN